MRRFALILVLVGLVYAGPTSLVAGAAATATPIADDQPLLVGLDNLEDAAIRSMQIEVIKQSGPIVLTFEVLRFTDAEAAEDTFAELVRRVIARFDADRNGADPYHQAAETPEIGAEAVAYTGEQRFAEPIGNIEASPVAIVFVRTGAYIHIGVSITLRGDPLPDLVEILSVTTTREVGARATPISDSGQRIGGLWDLLPDLDDVPPDFTITDEIVPEPFAPLPA